MHKPLNAQNLYNVHKSVYVCKSRLYCAKFYTYVHKSRATYEKSLTLCKAVHVLKQKLYNLRKDAYIAQSHTNTYKKYAHWFIK